MKYIGMPMGMWALFALSFQKQLTAVFGYDADAAKGIAKKAKSKYKNTKRSSHTCRSLKKRIAFR